MTEDRIKLFMTNVYAIMVFLFLGLYFIIESCYIKYRPIIGHTSGIIVLLGILLSFIIWTIIDHHNQNSEAS